MKIRSLVALLFSLSLASTATAETAIRDDGRQVKLNKDGTWEFVSDDIYATSESGLRVILQSDGTWESAVNKEKTQVSSPAAQSATATSTSLGYFEIDNVVIEKVQLKRSGASKNAIYGFRSIVTLNALKPVNTALLKPEYFKIRDNMGDTYTTLSLNTDDSETIKVIADGAPSSFFSKVKSYEVLIDKAAAESLSDIRLSYDFRDVKTVNKKEFSD